MFDFEALEALERSNAFGVDSLDGVSTRLSGHVEPLRLAEDKALEASKASSSELQRLSKPVGLKGGVVGDYALPFSGNPLEDLTAKASPSQNDGFLRRDFN